MMQPGWYPGPTVTWYLSAVTTSSLSYCVTFVFEGKRNKEFKFKKDTRSTLSKKTFFTVFGNWMETSFIVRSASRGYKQQGLELNHVSSGKYVRARRICRLTLERLLVHSHSITFPLNLLHWSVLYVVSGIYTKAPVWFYDRWINDFIRISREYKKFLEEIIAYFPLIRHGPHRKRRLQQFFVAAGTRLPSHCRLTIGGYTDRPTYSSLTLHRPHRNDVSKIFSAVACIRSRGNLFTNRCLTTIGRDTHTDTQTDGRDLWSTPLIWAQVPWCTRVSQ
jgi:hypothetical protein